jgi:hypothetical protein
MGNNMAVADKKTGGLSTVLEYWNAAYRGFVPGGINQVPPEISDIGPDPETIDTPDDPFILPDPEVKLTQNIAPMPVVIMDDISHTRKRVEKYNLMLTANVDPTSTRILIPRDPYRTQVILQTTGNAVWLGHNESVGTSGFLLPVSQVIVLGTTREVWAIAQTGSAQVSVLMEYDKDTA